MKNIAVIMAVYSGDDFEYLKDSLHSLYNQTYKNFDIFIQCDGLLESNVSMFLNFEHSSKRVFFLQKRRVNKGLAYSLNELLMVVLTMDYEYIARMDADDISLPKI